MAHRWSIKLAIEGDLRFLSHHDMLRAMERITSRAKLPLKYSQGFNPRPILSLLVPRPVGTTARDDRLLVTVEEDFSAELLCEKLNAQAPQGLRFVSASPLEPKQTPQPVRIDYELPLLPEEISAVSERLAELSTQETWAAERRVKTRANRRRRSGDEPKTKTIDLRPRLACIEIENDKLKFTCVPTEDGWAKPTEILQLAGLSQPEYLAKLIRTRIEDDAQTAGN